MLVCIVGPTACYKSNTAIYLAEKLNGEIISCDSVSVYKGLDIGSAKPTMEERGKVPHYMIDVVDPSDLSFSVSTYRTLADAAIQLCLSNHKLPIVCGGSGLYFDAIMHDMKYACPSSSEIRESLSAAYDSDPTAFHSLLYNVDPITAGRIPIRDKKRLVRAMEVFQITGEPFSSFNQVYSEAQSTFRYDTVRIGLCLPREHLYKRINERVDRMMQNGLLDEVVSLREQGLGISYPSMQSIGYKQLLMYLDGTYSLSTAIEEIKKASRHLAKRQITWFKRDPGITWFDCTEQDLAKTEIMNFVTKRLSNV